MDIAAVASEKTTIRMDATLSRWSNISTDIASGPEYMFAAAHCEHDLKLFALMKVGLP